MTQLPVIFIDFLDDQVYKGRLIFTDKIYLIDCEPIEPQDTDVDLVIYGSLGFVDVIALHNNFLTTCRRVYPQLFEYIRRVGRPN